MKPCFVCGVNDRLPYSSKCRTCHCSHQKNYYKTHPRSSQESLVRRRMAIRDFVKSQKDKPCTDCGLSFPWYVMDFDHVRGKKFNVSRATSDMRSIESIREEVAKCDVVCSNCHRIRTFTRLSIRK
jgi:hypothetical protein